MKTQPKELHPATTVFPKSITYWSPNRVSEKKLLDKRPFSDKL